MQTWTEIDQRMMQHALHLAKEAAKSGEVPIAAVISKDQEIIAASHNKKEQLQDGTAHAELLVIQEACRKLKLPYLEGCTLYVTLEPCLMCAGAIIHVRLPRLVFAASDSKSGVCGSLTNVFNLGLNHQPLVEQGLFEQEASQILKDFFKQRRMEKKRLEAADALSVDLATKIDHLTFKDVQGESNDG